MPSHPVCYIVPSAVVADVIRRSHQAWLAAAGRRGRARQDSPFRRFLPDYDRMGVHIGCGPGWIEEYRENWSRIESSANRPRNIAEAREAAECVVR